MYRRERKKNTHLAPAMEYKPIQTINNSAWQRGRKAVGLDDLHVHDLRHTVGMRLREAGVSERTMADILWHTNGTITQHYSMAQIQEIFESLEKIKEDTGKWNKSLATLRIEHEERKRREADPAGTARKAA